jgi:hypothetical protein
MQVFQIHPHQAYMVVRRQDTNKCSTVWYDAKHISFLMQDHFQLTKRASAEADNWISQHKF